MAARTRPLARALALVLGLLCQWPAPGTGGHVSLALHSFTEYPEAVCSDGSPSGVYFAPATSQPDVFVLWLQGGGWCYSAESCAQRWNTSQSLMSSKHWGSTTEQGGVLDTASVVGGANKAYLRYCTSDAHMGNGAAYGWHFKGQRTVEAAIAVLVGHGLKAGSKFVLGGSSAGGRGTMVTCDFLPKLLPAGVDYVCVPDSPFWVDLPPMNPAQESLKAITEMAYQMANASARVSPACAAAFPGGAAWQCLFGQDRMPTMQSRYLMYASQDDAFQLSTNIGHRPETAPELAYAAKFAALTRAKATALASPTTNAVYSSKCFNHAVSLSDVYLRETVQNVTMDGALRAFLHQIGWLGDPAPNTGSNAGSNAALPAASPTLLWADTCSGFACGPGCS